MPPTVLLTELLTDLARTGIRLRLAEAGRIEVSAPRGQLTAELRERIARHKPQLIEWLTAEDPGLPAIEPDPANRHEPFPLSDLQLSFLMGSGEGFEYHVRPHQYMEFDFAELDPARFEKALNKAILRQAANIVVVRHDLRLQTVRDPAPIQVPVSDFRGLTGAETRQGMERIRVTMRRRELPIDRWPWLDVRISLYGEDSIRLHYNNNNFFSDAPGTGGFLSTVLEYYRHPDRERPELELSYRDCVLALARLEGSQRGQAARKYWTDRIAGWPTAPDVPLIPGAVASGRSWLDRRELVLPATAWTMIKDRARRHGLTPTDVLTGIYAEVIAFWSGSRHFLLNNMMTHRLPLHPQIGEVLGNFAALYPLEVDWRGDLPFRERVGRLHAQVMADLAHTSYSGVKVLQEVNRLGRTPGRAVCPFAVGSALFVGQADRPVYSLLETPQVLLDCEFWEQRDGSLWVVWDVIESMFPAGLIDDMHRGYRTVLHQLAADETAWQQTAFGLLPASQREQRHLLNHSTAPRPPEGMLHDSLRRHASQLGGRAAVVAAGATLSYADLYRLAGQVSDLLRERGVAPGDLVAVAAPKGWAQVVAVFGVLGAGAAYVPVDPAWPTERIRLLLGDTAAAAVLTTEDLRAGISAMTGVPVLAVDWLPGREPPSERPVPRLPDDLAYVIYTSGSTGRPKGVMLGHRGPVNTINDINQRFGIGSDAVVFGPSSLCFDLSVYDIFGTVAAGGTLVLPDPSRNTPDAWAELVRDHGVTVWNSVPALMELLIDEASAAGLRFPGLRTVLLSGDWIPVQLPDRIRQVAPDARVISLGGATEASIWSICYPVDRVDPAWASIPYGTPLSGQSWHVIDAQGQDAPTWVTGHLHIGGVGVATGYLGDPELTAAAFVTHPRTGERLYRTGDLGRYLPSGDIEFLGRADQQVKIQGFRVEPGEIEHALLECADVAQAAVIARTTGAGRHLAAFVAGTPNGPRPDRAGLTRSLAARLPGYLVPSQITVMNRLPLTANGKLDRRTLEALDSGDGQPDRRPGAPRTTVEAELAALWQSVLSVSTVGVHDNFFDLGGQSFAALRMLGQLGRQAGRQVSLSVLLEHPTVAGLAAWLNAAQAPGAALVRLREGPGIPWYFVHPAGGDVLCYRTLAEALDEPVRAFHFPQPSAGERPQARMTELAERYLTELRADRPHGPYRLAGWSSGAVIAHALTHQLEDAGETVEQLVVIDAPAPGEPRAVDDAELARWFAEMPGLDAAQFPVFAAIVRACHAYAPPVVGCPVTVLRARYGLVTEFAAHPAAEAADWGWSTVTTGEVTARSLAGTHHTLLAGDRVTEVADAIRAAMTRSQEDS